MTGKAQVQALVAEIGPLLELGEVTAFDAEDLWTLVVDAETVLFLDYEQGQERLWLSGEVATPPPSERARLHETLLTYNHRWRDTGGLRMSLDGEGGAVVLSYDMPAEGLGLAGWRWWSRTSWMCCAPGAKGSAASRAHPLRASPRRRSIR